MATLASLVATVVGTVFAVALLRRWAARGRTPASLWWGLALAQFALASAALLLGQVLGWSGPLFRVFYLFGAVTNVLWLALGTVVINARRRPVLRVLAGVLLLTAALATWGASGDTPMLWLPTAVLAALLAVVLLLPRAATVQRVAAAVVVGCTLFAAVAVATAPFVVDLPAAGLPEGRELFGLGVRGLAVAGNTVGSVLVVVGALASSAHVVWQRPDPTADRRLRDVDVRTRSWFAATAEWLFAGRRGAARAGNVVRGNLLIALGVLLAAVALGDAETTGHAIGLAVGVLVMYAGFRRTLQPTEPATAATTGG